MEPPPSRKCLVAMEAAEAASGWEAPQAPVVVVEGSAVKTGARAARVDQDSMVAVAAVGLGVADAVAVARAVGF